MLALALMALVTSLLWGTFAQTARVKRRIEQTLDRTHTMRVNDFDELRFSWFGHQRLRADAAEGDTALVHYFTAPDPDDRMLVNLMRRETRRLEAKDPKLIPGETYLLCPAIIRLKFAYYDYKQKDWREEWDTTAADGPQYLPTQVRISLTVLDERDQPLTFTSIARLHALEKVDYRPGRS
jgi:hypothetical protein